MPAPKQLTDWMRHLNKVRKENPDKKLSECMKLASQTFNKSK